MHDYFQQQPRGERRPHGVPPRNEPIRPEYRDREACLSPWTSNWPRGGLIVPTLGMLYEEPSSTIRGGDDLVFGPSTAGRDEDWGFHFEDRILAAPYPSPPSLPRPRPSSIAPDQGAPVHAPGRHTATGPFSPLADPMFDGFGGQRARHRRRPRRRQRRSLQQRLRQRGLQRPTSTTSTGEFRLTIRMFNIERAAYDFLLTLAFDKPSTASRTCGSPRWRTAQFLGT